MPRDISLGLIDHRLAAFYGPNITQLHIVEDCVTGELYSFKGETYNDTKAQIVAFMKEWADRGTGRYDE